MAGRNAKQCTMTLRRVDFFEEFLKAFPEALSMVESEQKNLKEKLKARLIGKGGQNVKKMQRDTSTEISYREDHVMICGTEEGINKATELICEEIKEFVEKKKEVDIIVPIEKSMKGPVMGKNGQNLRELGEVDNTYVYRSRGDIHARAPNEEKAEQTRQSVLTKASKVKRKEMNRDLKERHYCFVDDLNLLQNDIILKEYTEDRLGSKDKEYILKASEPTDERSQGGAASRVDYNESVQVAVREVLGEIKDNSSTSQPWIDIWAHFGQVIICEVDEDKENDYFSVSEVQNLVYPQNSKNEWKTRFREGINLQLEGSRFECESWELEKDQPFVWRFDQGIRTPNLRSLRLKVWIAGSDFNGDINEVPLPNDDLQSVIGEVKFADDNTRANCRGWLCTETQQPLKVNIIFPSLPFSFRFGIRKGKPYPRNSKKDEQENTLLLEHLKTFTKPDGQLSGAFDTLGVALPKGFDNTYKRLSQRITYRALSDDNLSITLSKEKSKNNSRTRDTCDVHVRNSSWNDALKTGNWTPEDIAKGVPTFLEKLRNFCKFLRQKLQPGTEEQ